MFLLTIFLRHDQSKTLAEINAQLESTGYFDGFPPAGIEIVSWYVCMGIGQEVTLRVPDDPVARFPAVVAAAEAVLKVASEPMG